MFTIRKREREPNSNNNTKQNRQRAEQYPMQYCLYFIKALKQSGTNMLYTGTGIILALHSIHYTQQSTNVLTQCAYILTSVHMNRSRHGRLKTLLLFFCSLLGIHTNALMFISQQFAFLLFISIHILQWQWIHFIHCAINVAHLLFSFAPCNAFIVS